MRQEDGYHIKVERVPGRELHLGLSGRIALHNVSALLTDIRSLLAEKPASNLIVDLAEVRSLDSAGALVLRQMENEAEVKGTRTHFVNVTEDMWRVMELIDRQMLAAPLVSHGAGAMSLLEQVGAASRRFLNDTVQVITFEGELLRAMTHAALHPRSVRWNDVLLCMKKAGVDGLPILSLISFLLGLIMAFMSSLQLKQFGANIYVASLVSIAMIKELGPIMTAIVVAGRSGSAFAAAIGTMKVNEEVDALVTMGFDPTTFLAVPRVLATMLVVPLLTLYADLFAVTGGLMVGVTSLNLTAYGYIKQTMESTSVFDVTTSLIKSVVFAVLIAGIGCQRGFQAKVGAEAVGMVTTSAVVSALFLIIVTDSAFAIVLHYLG